MAYPRTYTTVMSLALASIVLAGCRKIPVTGRNQVLFTPEAQEMALGADAYQEILASEQPSSNEHYVNLVNRVGRRIAKATDVEGFAWEFKVIDSETQNAFCLPGGKVAVYEGILPVCHSEAGLAVVMSHEVAHAVARHGGERMSQGVLVDGSKRVLGYLTQNNAEGNRDLVMRAYGAASNYGFVLPYSRKHESEADAMGLVYMAKAGYDPREAPKFWERFGQATAAGGKPPEFLSTHPSDERRARDLLEQMPEAIALYQEAPIKLGRGEPIRFAQGEPSPTTLQR